MNSPSFICFSYIYLYIDWRTTDWNTLTKKHTPEAVFYLRLLNYVISVKVHLFTNCLSHRFFGFILIFKTCFIEHNYLTLIFSPIYLMFYCLKKAFVSVLGYLRCEVPSVFTHFKKVCSHKTKPEMTCYAEAWVLNRGGFGSPTHPTDSSDVTGLVCEALGSDTANERLSVPKNLGGLFLIKISKRRAQSIRVGSV